MLGVAKKHMSAVGLKGKFLYFLSIMTTLTVIYFQMERDPLVVKPADLDQYRVVHPGELVEFQRSVCTSKEVDVVVERKVYTVIPGDGKVESTDVHPSIKFYNLKEGCLVGNYSYLLPENLEPGDYVFQGIVSYDINPFLEKKKALPPMFLKVVTERGQ